MPPKFRNVCWTSFDNTEGDRPNIDMSKLSYCIWQLEKSPDTGRKHWQGYGELKNRSALSTCKQIFGRTTHLEPRRGTQEEAIVYCTKDETSLGKRGEHGTKKSQGERTDIEKIWTSLKDGATIFDICESHPGHFMRYASGIQRMAAIAAEPKARVMRPQLDVTVLWGATGTGKSWRANTTIDGELRTDTYTLRLNDGQVWWTSYHGSLTLIIEEFRCQIKLCELLQILDRYPLELNCKGFSTWAMWTHVIITSNHPPNEWYLNAGREEDRDALKRRFTKIIEVRAIKDRRADVAVWGEEIVALHEAELKAASEEKTPVKGPDGTQNQTLVQPLPDPPTPAPTAVLTVGPEVGPVVTGNTRPSVRSH